MSVLLSEVFEFIIYIIRNKLNIMEDIFKFIILRVEGGKIWIGNELIIYYLSDFTK